MRSKVLDTPYLLLDLSQVEDNYFRLRRWLPHASVHFSVKANPERTILQRLNQLGCGFQVSSMQELLSVSSVVVRGAANQPGVICTDPVNCASLVEAAYANDVRAFACDSPAEVKKIAELAPEAELYVRLYVPPDPKSVALSPVGVSLSELKPILRAFHKYSVGFRGFTFHVGSNACTTSSWRTAFEITDEAERLANAAGFEVRSLNLGGGLPADVNAAQAISQCIDSRVSTRRRLYDNVVIEPGRFLVGSAGVMVARVIGTAYRRERFVLHVDVGVYNGLHEASEGIGYPVSSEGVGPIMSCDILGPTCSGIDVIARDVQINEPKIGDRLYFGIAGAYTTSVMTCFCQLKQPATRFTEGQERESRKTIDDAIQAPSPCLDA